MRAVPAAIFRLSREVMMSLTHSINQLFVTILYYYGSINYFLMINDMTSSILTFKLTVLLLMISLEWIPQCHSWGIHLMRTKTNVSKNTNDDTNNQRRQFFQSLIFLSISNDVFYSTPAAMARNLPVSTGADLKKVGTVQALTPIVSIRYSLSKLETHLSKSERIDIQDYDIPTIEENFKRLFDAYSDPVSYKQKFLDNNAFLVYYTKGYDGPGRPNIEDDLNERQTLQFGARNEAWISWENFLLELKFINDTDNDTKKYLNDTIQAVDRYLKLAPLQDVREAQKTVGVSW